MDHKISSIDQKIEALRKKKKELQLKKHDKHAKLIAVCGLEDIEKEVLVGALLQVPTASKDKMEEWRKAGETFLKSKTITRAKKVA
jgi:Conjugal transfer protein TraD